jgi:hypothetical protein
MIAAIEEIGPPPWGEIVGQTLCKYATPACALRIATPWVAGLIERMRLGLPSPLVIDIRYWSHLGIGDLPGLPHWHYDCFNRLSDDKPARHRLYFAGAGCRPLFEGDYRPPEGWIIEYSHRDRHRIMPAEEAGPRVLVRVSNVELMAANAITSPPLFKNGRYSAR